MQLATWLVGAHAILTDAIPQPRGIPEVGGFEVGWSWSHLLDGNYPGGDGRPTVAVAFLPEANRTSILRIARGWAVEDALEDFMTDAETQAVAAEIVGMPERFLELYRTHSFGA